MRLSSGLYRASCRAKSEAARTSQRARCPHPGTIVGSPEEPGGPALRPSFPDRYEDHRCLPTARNASTDSAPRGGSRSAGTPFPSPSTRTRWRNLAARIDGRRGVLLASSYEYPGRYTRWDIGFADPPLEIVARGRSGAVRALNERGEVLLAPIEAALAGEPHVAAIDWRGDSLRFTVREPEPDFTEEDRSRQPTVFSALRAIVARFGAPDDAHFGLYGAFGYDLAFQFDPIELRRPRPESDRDLVLYLPDAILVVDHQAATAEEHRFDFTTAAAARRAPSPEPVPRPRGGRRRRSGARRTTGPASTRNACARRTGSSGGGISSRWCRGSRSSRAAPPRPRRCSGGFASATPRPTGRS